jgi:hypothetical protein
MSYFMDQNGTLCIDVPYLNLGRTIEVTLQILAYCHLWLCYNLIWHYKEAPFKAMSLNNFEPSIYTLRCNTKCDLSRKSEGKFIRLVTKKGHPLELSNFKIMVTLWFYDPKNSVQRRPTWKSIGRKSHDRQTRCHLLCFAARHTVRMPNLIATSIKLHDSILGVKINCWQ